MSDHDFEAYLALLAGMLRLDPRQRDAIAGELRDHLETRLLELREAGYTREQSVATALEEFGDAAGLAASFTRVAHQRRRRTIMQYSMATIGVCALLVTVVLSLLPTRPDVGVGNLANAQEAKAGGEEAKASPDHFGERQTEQDRAAAAKLRKPILVEFDDIKLRDVVAYLREVTGVNMYVEWPTLAAAGIDGDTPIKMSLKQVPAETALALVLRHVSTGAVSEVGYYLRDGVVIITSEEVINRRLEVRVYNVRDLLKTGQWHAPQREAARPRGPQRPGNVPGGFGAAGMYEDDGGRFGGSSTTPASGAAYEIALARLKEVVHGVLSQESWVEGGGQGTVTSYDGLLVVRQTARNHDEIRRLLAMLRQAAATEGGEARP